MDIAIFPVAYTVPPKYRIVYKDEIVEHLFKFPTSFFAHRNFNWQPSSDIYFSV